MSPAVGYCEHIRPVVRTNVFSGCSSRWCLLGRSDMCTTCALDKCGSVEILKIALNLVSQSL